MKNFTLFAAAMLCSAVISAQTPQLKELWNNSAAATEVFNEDDDAWTGTIPSFIGQGDGDERTMAYYDGKIYIPSKLEVADGIQPGIIVVDAATGNFVERIALNTDVVNGGQYPVCSIAIDEDGMMVLTNMVLDGANAEKPFKVYTYNLEDKAEGFKLLTSYADDAFNGARLGVAGMGLYGTIGGDAILMFASQLTDGNKVLKMTVKNGAVTENSIIELQGAVLGLSGSICGVTPESFIISSYGKLPTRYNMQGGNADVLEQVKVIREGTEYSFPNEGVSSGVTFNFKGVDYLFTAAVSGDGAPILKGATGNYGGMCELLKYSADGEGLAKAEHVAFACEEKGLAGHTGTRQTTRCTPVAAEVFSNKVNLYMFQGGAGLAAYEFTVGGEDALDNNVADAISVYPNPATDVLNISGDVTLVEFFTVAGQKVMEVANEKIINVAGLQGLYLVKVTNANGNVVSTKVSIK